MIIAAVLFVLFLIVLIIFAFPQFSPIPYFPSNPKDLPLIVKALKLKQNHTIFDLGAGDGIIVFEAARESLRNKLNTQFVAVEMNPILVFILHIRRILHPNRKNIKIILGDMFKIHYQSLTPKNNSVGIYIYVSPRFIPKIIQTVQSQFNHFEFTSYYYSIEKDMKPSAEGVHAVYTKTY